MSKRFNPSVRARKNHLPVMLVGLGAGLLLAGPAHAQSRACPVQFSISNASEVGALQLSVNYAAAAAAGDFASNGCVFAQPAVTDVHVNTTADTASIGWVDAAGRTGPGTFVTCSFVMPDSAAVAPVAGNFVVSIDDASNTDVPPAPASPQPTIAVSVGACAAVDSECQNGVIETGEVCDDGNDTAGDGCDAACGLSECPSEPSTGCLVSVESGKSKLSFKNDLEVDAKDQGQFQWKSGAATNVDDFANPVAVGATYSWCVYDGGVLVKGATVPGGASTWAPSGSSGFQFKGDVQGIAQIKLKAGVDGKASVAVKAKSKAGNFRSPTLPLTGPTLSHLVIGSGSEQVCFQTTALFSTNTETSYKAAGNP